MHYAGTTRYNQTIVASKLIKNFLGQILLCFSVFSTAFATEWVEQKTPHLVFIYPKPLKGLTKYLNENITTFESIYHQFKHIFPDLPESIPIILDPKPVSHNGMASPWPYKMVKIFLTPPQQDDIFGGSVDPLFETFVHELAHIAHYTVKSKGYKFLSSILGESITPAGMNPRWILEGFAVWMESRYSTYGRGKSTFTQGLIELLTHKWPTLAQLNGFQQAYPAGLSPYHFGYLFFEYLGQTYGPKKVFEYIHLTGSGWPLFHHSQTQKVFSKNLESLWRDAKQFYEQKLQVTDEIRHNTMAITTGGKLKSKGVLFKNTLVYWDIQPYKGYRLVQTPLVHSKLEPKVLARMPSNIPFKPLVAACHDTLYTVVHHLSHSGPTPALYRMENGFLMPYSLEFRPKAYEKIVSLNCHQDTLQLISYQDFSYFLLQIDATGKKIKRIPIPKQLTPIQVVHHPKKTLILAFDVDRINVLFNPETRTSYPLKWTRERKLYDIVAHPHGFMGIIDGQHGRSIVSLNDAFKPLTEWGHVLPTQLVNRDSSTLLIRYTTPFGHQFGSFELTKGSPFNETLNVQTPHRIEPIESVPDVPKPTFSYAPYNAGPYLGHHYWAPLVFAGYNFGVGFQTGGRDPLFKWIHEIDGTLFFLPWAGHIKASLMRVLDNKKVGIQIGYSKLPHSFGLEKMDHIVSTSLFTATRLTYPTHFFLGLSYAPFLNNKGIAHHRFYVPLRLTHRKYYASALHPYGWNTSLGLFWDIGTVDSLQSFRLLETPKTVNAVRHWRLDLISTFYLDFSFPLFFKDMGVYQSFQFIYRWRANPDLGPINPELFAPRPFANLLNARRQPLSTSAELFRGNMIGIYKLRPFFRLIQIDDGFMMVPLFFKSIWLEGVLDTAYDPQAQFWFGSFALKLQFNLTVFYNLPILFSIYGGAKWQEKPGFQEFIFGIDTSTPFSI